MKLALSLIGMFVASGALAQSPPLLPDPILTPGVIASADVNVVCARVAAGGTYSTEHRQTTLAMKKRVFAEYGLPVPSRADRDNWEVDHRLPLCLGGKDDIKNLWPQYREGSWGFPAKDKLESYLCRAVCAGKVSLADAQAAFLADWRDAYSKFFGPGP